MNNENQWLETRFPLIKKRNSYIDSVFQFAEIVKGNLGTENTLLRMRERTGEEIYIYIKLCANPFLNLTLVGKARNILYAGFKQVKRDFFNSTNLQAKDTDQN